MTFLRDSVRPRASFRSRLVALPALALALALVPVQAAQAADDVPADLHMDVYIGAGSSGTRVFTDFRILNGAVTDATAVRVTVKRAVGPDVVKESKPGASFFSTLNSGGLITAPIVVQPGTTDEAASSSWFKPEGVVWTPETVPTSVTLEIFNAEGLVLSGTKAVPTSRVGGMTLAEVLPPAPTMWIRSVSYNTSPYKGIAVNFEVDDFTDAEQVIVRVERSDGSSIVKVAKPALISGSVNIADHKRLTAPIVIQAGSYDEAGSSSWYVPSGVWTSKTVPVSVTVTVKRTYGPDLVATSTTFGGSADGILPEPSAPVQVTVPSEVPAGESFDVVVPEGTTGGELNLGAPVEGSVSVPVPVTVTTPIGVSVSIPQGVTITATGAGAADWDGVIQLPTVVDDVEVPGQLGEVALAIEVGSPTMRLTFDAPVRLVLEGQAGKKAAFIENGVFTEITKKCSANPPASLTGECWINDGDDLVIWTTHFTTFAAYASGLPATGAAISAPLVGLVGILGVAGVCLLVLGRNRRKVAA